MMITSLENFSHYCNLSKATIVQLFRAGFASEPPATTSQFHSSLSFHAANKLKKRDYLLMAVMS